MWRSPWAGIVLAVVIGGLLALAGKWSSTALIALIVLALVGALLPPLAFVIGVIAAIYLVLTQGIGIFARLNSDLHGG